MKVTIQIHDDLIPLVKAQCPKSLSTTTFCALLLEQGLTQGCTLTERAPASAGEGGGSVVSTTNKVSNTNTFNKITNSALEQHQPLILEFWRVKKGSRGETAWKRLQGQLLRLQEAYGDAVVSDQLELAINGKWAGIDFARYEQYKPTGKNAPKRVQRKLTPEEEATKKEADHKAWLKSLNLD